MHSSARTDTCKNKAKNKAKIIEGGKCTKIESAEKEAGRMKPWAQGIIEGKQTPSSLLPGVTLLVREL